MYFHCTHGWTTVDDFISVAIQSNPQFSRSQIQSPQSSRKKCTRFKSLYTEKCHPMPLQNQWNAQRMYKKVYTVQFEMCKCCEKWNAEKFTQSEMPLMPMESDAQPVALTCTRVKCNSQECKTFEWLYIIQYISVCIHCIPESRMCFLYNFYSIQFFSVQLFNEAAWSECNFNSSQYQKAFLQRSFSLSIQCVPVPSPVRVPLESGSCGSGRGGMLANI